MTTAYRAGRGGRLLEVMGLQRPELRAWALYDLASAAVLDVVVTAVFPAYFATVAAAALPPAFATARYAAASTVTLSALAALAPFLGTLADAGNARRRALACFLALGVIAVALLFFVGYGDWKWALVLFCLASLGTDGAALFHGSLLPHVARPGEFDRLSTTACALGYVGAGLVVALALAAMEHPGWFGLPAGAGLTEAQETLPARLTFLLVAGWWLAFSLPLLRTPCEPPAGADRASVWTSLRRVGERLVATYRVLRAYPQALRFAAAALLYGNGVATIVRMAVIYGAEVGVDRRSLLLAVVLVDLVGTPFAFAFGALAARAGAKRSILLGLSVYGVIAVLAYFTRTATHFFALAFLVATVQGGTTALSRSLQSSLVPPDLSGEIFGFLTLVGRLTAMVGPAVFALVAAVTGSSRGAILSVMIFFASGAALLALVDVERGQADALRPAPAGARRVLFTAGRSS